MSLPDGYRCICNPGYRLHPSQAYCMGIYSCPGLGWEQGWETESREQAAECPRSAVWLVGLGGEQSLWTKLTLTLGRPVSRSTIQRVSRTPEEWKATPGTPNWGLEASALSLAHHPNWPSCCLQSSPRSALVVNVPTRASLGDRFGTKTEHHVWA